MQVAPGFCLQREIDAAEYWGVDTPLKYDGRQFCLSYHLKGVCNSHCGGRHSNRTMS